MRRCVCVSVHVYAHACVHAGGESGRRVILHNNDLLIRCHGVSGAEGVCVNNLNWLAVIEPLNPLSVFQCLPFLIE